MTQQPLFAEPPAAGTMPPAIPRLTRARMWFENMRHPVDSSEDWNNKPVAIHPPLMTEAGPNEKGQR